MKFSLNDKVKIRNVIDRTVVGKGKVIGIFGCKDTGLFHGKAFKRPFVKISVEEVLDPRVELPCPVLTDTPPQLLLADALHSMALWNHKFLVKY